MSARFDLSKIRLSAETRALLPMSGGESAFEEQRDFGTWWMVPFARIDGLDLLGLRAMPERPMAEWPVVRAKGPAAITVASRAAHVVPMLVARQMAGSPRRWTEAAELLDNEWEELCRAHRALGGTDELAALRALANDRALQTACASSPSSARQAAVASMMALLDPTPETRAFAAELAMGGGADLRSPGAIESFGVWRAAATSLSLVLSQTLRDEPARVAAAWAMFAHPAGLDTVWNAPSDLWAAPDATGSAQRLYLAARLLRLSPALLPVEALTDPRWPAITNLSNAASAYSFDGVDFLEAAGGLDGRDGPGDAIAALHALTAVRFWGFLSKLPAFDEVIAAARDLAERRGWTTLAMNLEAVASQD